MRSPIIRAKDKGKQKVVESEVPNKRKIQEQIDAQVAREMEEEFVKENKRLSKQCARDSEIARLHAEEELKMMIEGLDRSNEVIAKHLQEYEQAKVELTVGERIELINEPVKYQDHHAKILKYQAQQSKPLTKKSAKRMKTSEDVSEEDLKGMMQLVPLEEVYVEALQVKHPIIDWEIHSEEKREYWKIIRLGGDIYAGRKGLSTKEGTCHYDDKKLTRRSICIAQSKALSPDADEPASLSRDNRQGEAFPTFSSLDAGQDRENIAKTSALPHESSRRVPSLDDDEGHQDLEISRLKARVKFLKDKDRRHEKPIQEDALITRGTIDIREDLGADKSNDTEEMVNVLSSMEAANIVSSGGAVASVSPVDVLPTAGVPTVSGSFPTVSATFTTASVVTPYTRRSRGITIRPSQPMRIPIIRAKDKGKEKVIETEVPKKRKLHEQIDARVARKIEEEFARENQRLTKADLSVREKIELVSELVKYQDHRAKILKYQAQQSKPLSKKEQREFYMFVLRSHAEWKAKHFKGMTLEQLKKKFIPVWKQWEDFVPMSSKKESERVKRQGLKIDQGSSKRVKISKGVFEGVSEEVLKGMMQLVPLKEVYIEALQVKHPIIDWEIHSKGRENTGKSLD
nr:hypothetical protein [Tanacetum cinerariifolium]